MIDLAANENNKHGTMNVCEKPGCIRNAKPGKKYCPICKGSYEEEERA